MSICRKEVAKGNSASNDFEHSDLPDVKKVGYLKKLKTMKKKYFVLQCDSESGPARLAYYDNEKKWKGGSEPKRSIILKTCFDINRKLDTRQKHVIALYTRDDCFAIVMDNEEELNEWLSLMLELQHGTSIQESVTIPKPLFEHVWQVMVKNKGLGSSRNLFGPHRLCLTSNSLSLVKMNPHSDKTDILEFPLMSIRCCGHSFCLFFMELGRSAITGPGELWMQTEDTIIAQNMHEAILGAMKSSKSREELGPHSRPRSASTSDRSNPISIRRPLGVSNLQCLNPNIRHSSSKELYDMSSRPRSGSESYHTCSTSTVVTNSERYGNSVSRMDILQTEFPSHWLSCNLSGEGSLAPESSIREEAVNDYVMMIAEGTSGEQKQQDYLRMNPGVNNSLNRHLCPLINECSDYLHMVPSISVSDSPTHSTSNYPISLSEASKVTSEKVLGRGSASNVSVGGGGGGGVHLLGESHSVNLYEGYLEMTPLSTSLPKTENSVESGYLKMTIPNYNKSLQDLNLLCSSTCGKLEKFQLDKVKSYFTPSENDEDYFKPIRAYSIGSHPQLLKTHLISHFEESRARANSLGSQSISCKRKGLPHIESELGALRCLSTTKSSSVPVLSNGVQQPKSFSAQNDCYEDLMEIDYNSSIPLPAQINVNVKANEYSKNFSFSSVKQHYDSQPPIAPLRSSKLTEKSEKAHKKSVCELFPEIKEDGVKATVISKQTDCKKLTHQCIYQKEQFSEDISKILYNDLRYCPQSCDRKDSIDNLKLPECKYTEVEKDFVGAELYSPSFQEHDNVSFTDDYVNLDISTTYSTINCSPSPTRYTSTSSTAAGKWCQHWGNSYRADTLSTENNKSIHEYMNIQVQNNSKPSLLSPGSSPSFSNTTVMAPVVSLNINKIQHKHGLTLSSSEGNRHLQLGSCSQNNISLPLRMSTMNTTSKKPQSFPTVRKQMSAPAAPPSLHPDIPSPGRKTSCPASTSFAFAKEHGMCTVNFSKMHVTDPDSRLKTPVSHPPDASSKLSAKNVGEKLTSENISPSVSAASSGASSQWNVVEAAYENISVGLGSSSHSKPSSTNSEKKLNYVSLDLAPSGDDEYVPRSPSNLKTHQVSDNNTVESPLLYAEIDFTKSEGLRHTSGTLRDGRL